VTRSESIRQCLEAQLSPAFLDVINESGNHSVPKGSETHFKVVVVSAAFDGKSQLARHRQVYALLDGELKTGMHALTVTARTPTEWSTAEGSIPLESPACLGGSKKTSHS
jgi:stress-induced morphogen